MSARSLFLWLTAASLLCGTAPARATAQDVEPAQGSAQAQTNRSPPVQPAAQLPAAEALAHGRISTNLEPILRMNDAGVSKEVIRTYVETAMVSWEPTPEDLIALKAHGVPDDIAAALLKRAERTRAEQPRAKLPLSALQGTQAGYLRLDPESYDYFQYYYLQPRALAAAAERLSLYRPPNLWSYPGPFVPYSYWSVDPAWRGGHMWVR